MQERAARTRRAIIDAAAELFDGRGMKSTGLLDISRAAGVSKGALYFHFDSKYALAFAVWREARARVRALADDHLDRHRPTLASMAGFSSAVTGRLRQDPVVRAGMRLEAEGDLDHDDTGTRPLRAQWVEFLRHHFSGPDRRESLAPLLAAVTVGLETLGREDPSWWDAEVVSGIWDLITSLETRSTAGRVSS